MVTRTILRDFALATAAAALVAAALASAETAVAQASPHQVARQACVADVHRLCAGIAPGAGRIRKCVIDKYAQLSDACKNAMRQAGALSAERNK